MKRIDQIQRLSVVDVKDGKRIGKVEQVLLDGEKRTFCGIVWRPQNLFVPLQFCPIQQIRLIGEVSILIQPERVRQRKPAQHMQLGQKVYTTDGLCIGWFTNALLDESNAAICFLEVSKGYFDDWRQGRIWLSSFSAGSEGIVALTVVSDAEQTA